LRANIADVESLLGFLADNPAWRTAFTPYRVTVTIRTAKTGSTIMNRISFQADQLPQTPYIVHYAPGTIEDDNMQECVGPPALKKCAGTYWFRPFSRFHEKYGNTHHPQRPLSGHGPRLRPRRRRRLSQHSPSGQELN
jgi:hypothetical protein